MGIFSKPAPPISCISKSLVRAFSYLMQHPGTWFTASELVTASGVSKALIYRRFADLAKHKAIEQDRVDDFRRFRLHPKWADTAIGQTLHARAVADGILDQ